MPKILLVYILFIFLLFINASKAQVVLKPLFSKSTSAIVIDGKEDSEWSKYESSIAKTVLVGQISSPSDLTVKFQTIWDNEALYVLVKVTDDVKHNDNDASVWQNDGIEVYLDMKNDKSTSFQKDDYLFQFRWNDKTVHEQYGNINGISFVQTDITGGYQLEIKFLWQKLGVISPTIGTKLGFDLHCHDDDGNKREAKVAWYTKVDESWQNPSLFASLSLLGDVPLEKIVEPSFSKFAGFYTNPFELEIGTKTNGANIKYTLDCSDPLNSSNAITSQSPLKININPVNTTGRSKTPCVVVRAIAVKDGLVSSKSITQTYIFLENVKNQEHPGKPYPMGWINDQELDFAMDLSVIKDSKYTKLIDTAFRSIPSISLVTDEPNLFDASNGIYVNAMSDGEEWEVPSSIELVDPHRPFGFQANAGLRIRGGWSRHGDNPKHAFRIFFNSEYGIGKLKYPLFENEGTDKFDKFDLRCEQNYSWSYKSGWGDDNGSKNTMVKEVFFRDKQGEMDQPYTRSRYYHLYLNGMYWGIYQTQERVDGNFGASYLGGNAEDYDVLRVDTKQNMQILPTEGNDGAWKRLWQLCQIGFVSNDKYYNVQGLNVDGSKNISKERLLDVDNLINYMLLNFYGGNFDSPISKFIGNARPNNVYAIYNRTNPDGFKFLVHDAEHTMTGYDGIEELDVDRTGPYSLSDDFSNFNPQYLHQELSRNYEYRMRFADIAYRNLFNQGLLTPDAVKTSFLKRAKQIEMAVIAESARWGDSKVSPARTKDKDWIPAINHVTEDYIPIRTNFLISQLLEDDLFTSVTPPQFFQKNSEIITSRMVVDKGFKLKIGNPGNSEGIIYYTLDGNDPRKIGDEINPNALIVPYDTEIEINTTSRLKSRVKVNNNWSALHEVLFALSDDASKLKITEIQYNPKSVGIADSLICEFLELKNTGETDINLSDYSLTSGFEYTFPVNTIIKPNQFYIISSNKEDFKNIYGFYPDGEYIGKLSNKGEALTIVDATGKTIIDFKFNNQSPWPLAADGLGNSLVPVDKNATGDPNDPKYWRASTNFGGSPGKDDPEFAILPVLINEILSNSTIPEVDAIEIYNPNNQEVNISGWYLTDELKSPKKWKIPVNTIIHPKGYFILKEGHYNSNALEYSDIEFGKSFSLSSSGEEIYLYSSDNEGNLTGYVYGFKFEAVEANVTIGRYLISTGEEQIVAQSANTMGNENGLPRVGPLVISEINYAPVNGFEYIEIENISSENLNLHENTSGWKVSGIGFEFPKNSIIKPGEKIYLTDDAIDAKNFKYSYFLDEATQIYNIDGNLDDKGEKIEILKPFYEDIATTDSAKAYITIDKVDYKNKSPWPADAATGDKILKRKNLAEYGNEPVNWEAVNKNYRVGISFNYIENKPFIKISPNPVKDQIKIIIRSSKSYNLTINLLDINGKKLKLLSNIFIENGIFNYNFDISAFNLSKGMYFLRIETDNHIQLQKLIIQ